VIHVTGNSGIDALLQAREMIRTPVAASPRKTVLVTCHRRENQGELARICATLIRLAAEFPVRILFPLHPNRHIRTAVQAVLGGQENIELLEAVDHPEMVRLIDQSWVLLTDSGGLQEEGTTLGRPVLVMRNVTERIEAGPNVELVGIEPNAILAAVHRLLMDEVHYARMAHAALPFGDGRAGPRIAAAIEDWLAKRTLRIAV
jgi:UDP-N-acetylglucosamine 2-epimerase (non-hydrolysing)